MTVKAVFPEMLPDVAVMVAEPLATAVARPLTLTVAIAVLLELHVAVEVKS